MRAKDCDRVKHLVCCNVWWWDWMRVCRGVSVLTIISYWVRVKNRVRLVGIGMGMDIGTDMDTVIGMSMDMRMGVRVYVFRCRLHPYGMGGCIQHDIMHQHII